MKKVLVTGATGFIGYHLVKELSERGIEVYAVCSTASIHQDRLKLFSRVKVISCDLNELKKIPDMILERDFDAVYHLAWQGASGELRTNCEVQIDNIKWLVTLVEVAKKLCCSKIVVTGTVCEKMCDEIFHKAVFHKSYYYLLAKKTAYEFMRMNCMQENISLVWCDFYHPIGKYNKIEQLIANTIWKMERGEIPRFSSGTQLFDVIAVEDLAHGLYLAGEKTLKRDQYFIGSGQPKALREYLLEVKAIVKPDAQMEFGFYPDDGLRIKKEWLDIQEFSMETGYKPRLSFEEGVISTWNWIKAQMN